MHNSDAPEVFPPFRLVVEFADGARLLFGGMTEQQALDRISDAIPAHGDVSWYDGVTDLHYEKGRYYKLVPPTGLTVAQIDLTEYDGPLDQNGLPPELTGEAPVDETD